MALWAGKAGLFKEFSIRVFQDTVSVHRPGFYADRFFKFMSNTVFRKTSCEYI